jgi:hypothetical protein
MFALATTTPETWLPTGFRGFRGRFKTPVDRSQGRDQAKLLVTALTLEPPVGIEPTTCSYRPSRSRAFQCLSNSGIELHKRCQALIVTYR